MVCDELKDVWKEVVTAYSRYYLGICMCEFREMTRNLFQESWSLAEIRALHLPNKSQKQKLMQKPTRLNSAPWS